MLLRTQRKIRGSELFFSRIDHGVRLEARNMFQDAPRASAAARQAPPTAENHERVRILRTVHRPAPPPAKGTRGSSITNRILRTPHAPAWKPPKTTRRTSNTNRVLKTLHAPAPPPAKNHERVVDHEQNTNRILRTLHAKTSGRRSDYVEIPPPCKQNDPHSLPVVVTCVFLSEAWLEKNAVGLDDIVIQNIAIGMVSRRMIVMISKY